MFEVKKRTERKKQAYPAGKYKRNLGSQNINLI